MSMNVFFYMAEIKKIAKQQGIDSKPFIDDMQTGNYDHAFEVYSKFMLEHGLEKEEKEDGI